MKKHILSDALASNVKLFPFPNYNSGYMQNLISAISTVGPNARKRQMCATLNWQMRIVWKHTLYLYVEMQQQRLLTNICFTTSNLISYPLINTYINNAQQLKGNHDMTSLYIIWILISI